MCYCSHIHILNDKDFFDYMDIFLDPIIAIITFGLGFWVSNYFTNKKENKKLNDIINYFDLYFEDQNKSIYRQIESYRKLEDDLEKITNTNGVTFGTVQQPYAIIDTINKESLLSAWTEIKKREPKKLIGVLKYIEYTKTVFDSQSVYHKEFLFRQNELRLKWMNKINEFMRVKGKMLEIPIDQIKRNPILFQFNNICNEWQKPDHTIAFVDTITYLVQPILTLFGPIYSKDPENQQAYQLILLVQEINALYEEWNTEKSMYSGSLKTMVERLEEKHKEITDLLS